MSRKPDLKISDLDLWNFSCNLHNIGNHCVKYERSRSKREEEFTLQAVDRFKVNVTLTCDSYW